jgi:hypothetical protein
MQPMFNKYTSQRILQDLFCIQLRKKVFGIECSIEDKNGHVTVIRSVRKSLKSNCKKDPKNADLLELFDDNDKHDSKKDEPEDDDPSNSSSYPDTNDKDPDNDDKDSNNDDNDPVNNDDQTDNHEKPYRVNKNDSTNNELHRDNDNSSNNYNIPNKITNTPSRMMMIRSTRTLTSTMMIKPTSTDTTMIQPKTR